MTRYWLWLPDPTQSGGVVLPIPTGQAQTGLMKISHDTPDLLVLDDIPWITGLLMSGFILAFVGPGILLMLDGEWQGIMLIGVGGGIGALAFFGLVRRTQLIFDRPAGRVTLRTRTLRAYRETVFRLSDVSRARLQAHYSDNSKMYRLAIEISDGPDQGVHPTTPVYTNGKGPHRAEEIINIWLKAAR